jgi:hypothetical protein
MQNHAITAAGETQSSVYLKQLITMIDKQEPDSAVIKALSKYPLKRLNKVIEIHSKSNQSFILRNMPKVLELKPNQDAITALQFLMEANDEEVRSNAILSLRILSDNFPLLQIDNHLITKLLIEECKYTNNILTVLSLYTENETHKVAENNTKNHPLIAILQQKIDNKLKVIFELLHIKYPPENYIELYSFVRGADTELRNNAIEYVDNSLTYDLKSAIVPLLEYITAPEAAPNIDNDLKSRQRIKTFLLQNKDEEIRKLAEDFYK